MSVGTWGALSEAEAGMIRSLMPPILGLTGDDLDHVETAIGRLDDFLLAIDEAKAAELHLLLTGLRSLSKGWFWGRDPHELNDEQRATFLARLFDRKSQLLERIVEAGGPLVTGFGASGFDVARSLRELLCVCYWSNPATDPLSGYVPVWEREDVLAADPTLPETAPWTTPDRTRLATRRIQEKLTAEIAETINDVLQPRGVAVVIEAKHQCMTTRGVHKPGVKMLTSKVLGCFRDDPATRREFLGMIGH